MFKFVVGFIDRASGCFIQAQMTGAQNSSSKLVKKAVEQEGCFVFNISSMQNFSKQVKTFEKLVMKTFGAHSIRGLYALTFQLLNHIMEDIEKCKCFEMLDSSSFERFSVQINQAFSQSSRRLFTCLKD